MKKLKNSKVFRWFLYISAACLVVFILARIYFNLTDDFRIANMVYEMPYRHEWATLPPSDTEQARLDLILRQKFRYLGKGAQSYVFSSADQRYVLKFFKFKHLKPSWIVNYLPSIPPFKEIQHNEVARKKRKLEGVFQGYKLAYEVHRPESGLVFIQLNPSNVTKEITVFDKLGFKRTIDLGSVVYIVQEKAETLRSVLKHLLDAGKIDLAKKKIGQVFDLYLSEYEKGIYDRDHGVLHNIGFVGDRPIHLDVGKLSSDYRVQQPAVYQEDILKVAYRIEHWLRHNYSHQYLTLIKDIENRLSQILEKDFHFQ